VAIVLFHIRAIISSYNDRATNDRATNDRATNDRATNDRMANDRAANEMTREVHMLIRGEVQGIGFREYARRKAERLGVSGWVRNL
jgi:hypothetical protein